MSGPAHLLVGVAAFDRRLCLLEPGRDDGYREKPFFYAPKVISLFLRSENISIYYSVF
jgi:hypothetical protein